MGTEENTEILHVRTQTWGKANLSWSVVMEELLYAAEKLGHRTVFLSTNGYEGMRYLTREKAFAGEFYQRTFLQKGKGFDIDITYTAPPNFQQRFLKSSACRMAIYAYESSLMPADWRRFYQTVDYVLPPSQYVADMFLRNGCPPDKIRIVPHGVDVEVFNPDAKPIQLPTAKKYKFLCVAEPHYRKQLDKLLDVYCRNFTSQDDCCLILKTKIFKTSQELKDKPGFEMDLRPVLIDLKKRYGTAMPEIKLISERLDSMAGLYTSCDCFVLMSASEGWGVPYLEALATGLPVVAPRHGGQLEFLNDRNSILVDSGERQARSEEIYWGGDPLGTVGAPSAAGFGKAMRKCLENGRDSDTVARIEEGLKTANQLTWKNAFIQIQDIASRHQGKV